MIISKELQGKIIDRTTALITGKNGLLDSYHVYCEGKMLSNTDRAQIEFELIKALRKIFPIEDKSEEEVSE